MESALVVKWNSPIFNKNDVCMGEKMKFQKSLMLILLTIVGIASSQNLLSDPGFENGATWSLQVLEGAATANFTAPSAARTGSSGAAITVTQAASENWRIQLQIPRTWDAVAGRLYRLRFWARASANLPIHLAVQGGVAAGTPYIKGSDYSLSANWQQVEITHLADTSGRSVFVFHVFVGAQVGEYYFDDFELIAESVDLPTTIQAPAQGAVQTGVYRNLFAELGRTQAEIDAKVLGAFNQFFVNGSENQMLLYPAGNDMAFIRTIDTDDIRSEGLSYALMIFVQLDQKELFDKVWRFSHTHARHATGPRAGSFAWQLSSSAPYAVLDSNSASDGEKYFAMALLFAEARWGNGTGIFNYGQEARQLLDHMLRLEERNGGQVNQLTNFFNASERKVVFVPRGNDALYTDPSYHLPAFYRIWARAMPQDSAIWNATADTSAVFFARAMHPQTGLTTDYMTFAGLPQSTSFNQNSDDFAYDSWRVAMNLGMDAHWSGASYQAPLVDRLLGFFRSQGNQYLSIYSWDGIPATENNYHSAGLVAMNAVGALAASDASAWHFVQEFWNAPVPSGQYRYYDGMLHMLALLHCSGKFRAWGYELQEPSRISPPSGSKILNGLRNQSFLRDLLGRRAKK